MNITLVSLPLPKVQVQDNSTPGSIVRLMVEMIEPYEGKIFDSPVVQVECFVQFLESHGGDKKNISIYGQDAMMVLCVYAK
jgi:type I restriction-modification system DNA methylase subunit